MSMVRFGQVFRELAIRETRCATLPEPVVLGKRSVVPADEYGFDELYCDEPGCDCRRVMINVLSRHRQQHVATINHAFDPPTKNDLIPDQTFLDPLNRQSPAATGLLKLFVEVILADEEYCQRLLRHYRMFKSAVDDPTHPAHRFLSLPSPDQDERPPRRHSIRRPPPRSGKRKKRR